MIEVILVVLSLIGVILNIYKNSLCFVLWSVTNIGWAILDFNAELYGQSILFLIYFILTIWGIIKWQKN